MTAAASAGDGPGADLAAGLDALRRIAALAAKGGPQRELFEVVAVEASRLTGEDTTLLRAGRDGSYVVVAVCGGPAQIGARDDHGVPLGVRVPIFADGLMWGILGASNAGRSPPASLEQRLAQFAELAAAALAGAQVRSDLQRLTREQTALRAVAELVARAASTEDIFAAIAVEASRLLDGAPMTLTRFDSRRELVVLAAHGGPAPAGTAITYEPGTLPDRVRRDGEIVRVDDYSHEADAELAREFNLAAAVSAPVLVGGQVWGMLTATAASGPLPADAEENLLRFTSLVTAPLASIQARGELQALADEQAALRSVAELAARDVPADEVLAAVASQASRLTDVDFSTLLRFEPGGSTEIAALDGAPPGVVVGMRAPAAGDGAVQRVWRTGQPARIDNLAGMSGHWPQVAHGHGFSTSAAVPIFIHATLWGALVVVGRDKPLPPQIHTHLTSFAELAGTAISAAEARQQLRQLAEEQGALRRVAELVARGAALPEVFTAVATEASSLLGNLAAALLRFDPDETAVAVAACNSPVPLGLRIPAAPGTAVGAVRLTGEPFRVDNFRESALAGVAGELGITAGVAVPVTLEGRVWGTLTSSSAGPPIPAGTEERLTPFAELAAAAIANAENKEKLTASRARVVATADETRRRLQRDVHDSAQQRLVHTIITLKLAKQAVADGGTGAELIDEALHNAQRANHELRDVVHGILPAALNRGGLWAGIESLISDFPLPVELDAAVPRLSPDVETTAYFIVAEALTNVTKHARASTAAVKLEINGGHLDIEVRDDGTGGADPKLGSGLTGLLDRIEANDGTLAISSPPGAGTRLHATLPVLRSRRDPD